ncbi:MAG: carbohydrate ABC transporter permease [Bacillota bacterium]
MKGTIVSIIIWGAALIILFPFIWMVLTSLKPRAEVFRYPPVLLPSKWIFANYIEAWNMAPFGRFLLNSFIVSTGATLGVIITSALAAYSFARLEFPGRDAVFMLFLGSMMVPHQVTMIPSFLLVKWLNWVDTYQALIVPKIVDAFSIFLLRQYFQSIPVELEEAAAIDGCTSLGILGKVILPLSKPVLAAVGILRFLNTWNDFLWPLLVVTTEEMQTVQLGLAVFRGDIIVEWHLLMAGTVLVSVPTMLVYLLLQRHFVEGMVMSGLKA